MDQNALPRTPQHAVMATLLFFQQWNLPLIPLDILRFLPCQLGHDPFFKLNDVLETLLTQRLIERDQGFYFLSADRPLLMKRCRAYNASLTKWKIVKRVVRWIRWVPFLRMVAVTNTLAMNGAQEESDIDVLVVGDAGRIWTVRFLVSAVVHCLGSRRYGSKIQNRICLSFYLSDRRLDLRRFFFEERDLHYAYWVGATVPMFEAYGSGVRAQFEESNRWIKTYFPQHWWVELIERYRVEDSMGTIQIRRALECLLSATVGNGIDRILRSIQRKKIYAHHESRVHDPRSIDVVVNDDVLKFHESDSRAESRKRWKEECQRYGITGI